MYVVTGPVLSDNLPTIGANEVAVPGYYYTVILDFEEPELKGIGFILANEPSTRPVQDYAVTIDSVEAVTGTDFFPAIEDSEEEEIESAVRADRWSF